MRAGLLVVGERQAALIGVDSCALQIAPPTRRGGCGCYHAARCPPLVEPGYGRLDQSVSRNRKGR